MEATSRTSLQMLLLLTTATAAALQQHHRQSVGQMVVFSTRSRHTYGFHSTTTHDNLRVEEAGSGNFDLPLLEFQALFRNDNTNDDETTTDNSEPYVGLHAVDSTSDNLFWAVPNSPAVNYDGTSSSSIGVVSEPSTYFRARVAHAASRAILTHASFEMLLSIPKHLLCETANMSAAAGCKLSMFHTEVVDMRNPNLSVAERQALLVEAGLPAILPNREKSRTFGEQASSASSNVLLRRFDGHIHVGHRTGTGPAAPGSGAPGIKPRRNYKGILGKLALKNRLDTSKHLTTTAMEPEIALIMANLGSATNTAIGSDAKTHNGHIKVLDPCCGSCSLLIAAAACGATTLVGVDLNATAFLGADQEFQRHGFPHPLLVKGSILEPHLTTALAANDNTYHTILCDPPYGIGAPVLHDQQRSKEHAIREGNANSNTRKQEDEAHLVSAETIVAAVLDVARQTLVIGGRLVMFVPVLGRKGETAPSLSRVLLDRGCSIEETNQEDVMPEDEAVLSTTAGSLRLLHGRLQRFSPTFSRWLVVMEKVR